MSKKFRYLSGAILLGASIVVTPLYSLADMQGYVNNSSEHVQFNVEDVEFQPILSEDEINKRTQELGEHIRKVYENNSKNLLENVISTRSATSEQWSLVSTTNLTSVSTLSTSYRKIIGTGMSESTSVTFNFGTGVDIKGYKLDILFNKSTTQMMYGPSYNDRVAGSTVAATHAYITAAQQGKVVQYKYKVTTAMGNFLRYEYKNAVVDGGTVLYSQRANIGNPRVLIENTNRTNSKTYNSHTDLVNSFGIGKTSAMFF